MYAGAKCVYHQLRDRDQDSAHALVSNAQYLFAVADHDYIDVFRIAPLLEIVLNTIHIVNIQEAPFRFSKQTRVVGDRIALGRCVYDGEHFLQMVEDELTVCQLRLGLNPSLGYDLPCSTAPRSALSGLS
jgi:hypothetical protein